MLVVLKQKLLCLLHILIYNSHVKMVYRYLVMEHFNCVPKFFYQLYSLHAFQNGQYIPCVFFSLRNKSKECKIRMFRFLFDVCTKEKKLTLNIEQLNLDFEYTVHEAIRHFWPNIMTKGCQFHFLPPRGEQGKQNVCISRYTIHA
jgi:hypothetical protein